MNAYELIAREEQVGENDQLMAKTQFISESMKMPIVSTRQESLFLANCESLIQPVVTTLLVPIPLANPNFSWGHIDASSFINQILRAYEEVIHWRKTLFLVPFGNTGKRFVSELARLYKAYAEGSALECIALKATTVFVILALQKPHKKSKSKDHVCCLERRLQC